MEIVFLLSIFISPMCLLYISGIIGLMRIPFLFKVMEWSLLIGRGSFVFLRYVTELTDLLSKRTHFILYFLVNYGPTKVHTKIILVYPLSINLILINTFGILRYVTSQIHYLRQIQAKITASVQVKMSIWIYIISLSTYYMSL